MADPADDPETVLQKKTRAELLHRSLARLSPEHGEVIDLVYFHGRSVKEVAEIVGITPATVKTRTLATRDPANGLSFKFARQSLPPRRVPLRLSSRHAVEHPQRVVRCLEKEGTNATRGTP